MEQHGAKQDSIERYKPSKIVHNSTAISGAVRIKWGSIGPVRTAWRPMEAAQGLILAPRAQSGPQTSPMPLIQPLGPKERVPLT